MKILAIDTANGICSVALWDSKLIDQIIIKERSRQAERLLCIIEDIFNKNNYSYTTIDAIAVNIGPGSFTGVRIGLAAAQGIKLVNNTPLIAVTSFEAVAAATANNNTKNMLVVLDARRNQVFTQLISNSLIAQSDAHLVSYDDVIELFPDTQYTIIGDGAHLLDETITDHKPNLTIEAQHIAKAGAIKGIVGSEQISPLYIRRPDAKKTT